MSFFKDTFKIYVSFHVIIFTKEFFFPNVLLLYMNAAAVIAVAPPLPSAVVAATAVPASGGKVEIYEIDSVKCLTPTRRGGGNVSPLFGVIVRHNGFDLQNPKFW